MKLVLAGGGHGHVFIMRQIATYGFSAEVTLISDKPVQYYSGMLCDYITGIYTHEEVSFDLESLSRAAGVTFVHDKIVEIDANQRVVIGKHGTYPYDLLSMDLGSKVPSRFGGPTVKPLPQVLHIKEDIEQGKLSKLTIIGGGASGAELALAYRQLALKHGLPLALRLFVGDEFLRDFPRRAQKLILQELKKQSVAVIHDYLMQREDGKLIGAHGTYEDEGVLLEATGPAPNPITYTGFELGPQGYLLVDQHLQAGKNAFAMGDMIDFGPKPLPKVGVYAIRQSPILWHNLQATALDMPLKTFTPQESFLGIISLGDRRAVAKYGPLTFSGKAVFRLKSRIDTAFMNENKGRK